MNTIPKKEIKPNLFIIGASKCGTTFFFSLLSQHYQVCTSIIKEPFYFQRHDYYKDLDWYRNLFKHCNDEKIIAEASPIYSETIQFPYLPERLYKENSKAKIIFLVRNPLDRIKSVWRQTLSTGHHYRKLYYNIRMPKKFRKAVFTYPAIIQASMYWSTLQKYREVFPKENIKVIFFEELVNDTKYIMSETCNFLKIDQNYKFNLEVAYKNESKGKVKYQPIIQMLRKSTFIKKVHKILPLTIFYRVLRKRAKPVPKNIEIDKMTMERICNILVPEIEKLLKDQGKPIDYWKV